jgi:ribosomal protein L11
MKMGLALAGGLLVMASLAQAAEIKVLSGNGAKAAVRELCTQFERATGNKINLHFEVNTDIQKKIEAGEAFDVAVLNPPVIEALSKEAKIVAGSRADMSRRSGRCSASGRTQAGHLIRGRLPPHAACGESRCLPRKGSQRIVFCEPAGSHGDQGGDAWQTQADGGGRHR